MKVRELSITNINNYKILFLHNNIVSSAYTKIIITYHIVFLFLEDYYHAVLCLKDYHQLY